MKFLEFVYSPEIHKAQVMNRMNECCTELSVSVFVNKNQNGHFYLMHVLGLVVKDS